MPPFTGSAVRVPTTWNPGFTASERTEAGVYGVKRTAAGRYSTVTGRWSEAAWV